MVWQTLKKLRWDESTEPNLFPKELTTDQPTQSPTLSELIQQKILRRLSKIMKKIKDYFNSDQYKIIWKQLVNSLIFS